MRSSETEMRVCETKMRACETEMRSAQSLARMQNYLYVHVLYCTAISPAIHTLLSGDSGRV